MPANDSLNTPGPRSGPYLFLNGDTRTGLVNNLCFPSEVVPGYAPEGQSLASVSVIGDHADLDDAALEKRVRGQLSSWFGGAEVDRWRHLRTYRIPFSQPGQVSMACVCSARRLSAFGGTGFRGEGAVSAI